MIDQVFLLFFLFMALPSLSCNVRSCSVSTCSHVNAFFWSGDDFQNSFFSPLSLWAAVTFLVALALGCVNPTPRPISPGLHVYPAAQTFTFVVHMSASVNSRSAFAQDNAALSRSSPAFEK